MFQSDIHSTCHSANASTSAAHLVFWDDANGDRPLEIRVDHFHGGDIHTPKNVMRSKQLELRTAASSATLRCVNAGLDNEHKALSCCGHALSYGSDGMTFTGRKFEDGSVRAGTSGVQTCQRVWLCAVCAAQRARHDAADILKMSLWATSKGYSLSMMTLTIRHHAGMKLSTQFDAMPKAFAAIQRRASWRNFVKGPYVGMVRAVEVTHGRNGWHLHFHIVFVMDCSSHEATKRLSELKPDWLKCLKAVGLEASGKRGFDVRPMANADEYLTKFGNPFEIVSQCTKEGREGNRTAWQLLDAYVHGDLDAADRWLEYAFASKRRQRVVWSNGLKALCGVDRDEPDDGEPEASIEVFRHTITDPDQRERVRFRLGELLRSVEQCRDGDYLGAFLRCLNGETRDFDVWRRLWPYRETIRRSLSSIPR